MGKATEPAKYRHRANEEQKANNEIVSINGVDNNRSVSPLIAWRAKGMMEQSHEAAISYCFRLWDILTTEPRTTSSYDEPTAKGHHGGESGRMILTRMEANDDLKRISGHADEDGNYREGYIPRKYWHVFENTIRFDEPTGIIGSKYYGGTKTARTRAHVTVCFVADLICDREGLLR